VATRCSAGSAWRAYTSTITAKRPAIPNSNANQPCHTSGAATPGEATFAKPGATEHGLAASYTSTITAKRPATPNSCEEDPLQIRGGILEPSFDRPLSMQHVWMAGGQDADL